MTPITPIPIPQGARHLLLIGGTFDPPHEAHAAMALAARDAIGVPLVAARSDQCDQPAGHTTPTTGDSTTTQPSPTAILFVPAARSPFKPAPLAPDALRVEMLTALASTVPAAAVWTDELDRASASPNTPSYWIDTLERAHAAIIAQYLPDPAQSTAAVRQARHAGEPLPTLHFLIGVDQAVALHRWKEPRRVLELAHPVIALRPPMAGPSQLAAALREADFWGQGEIDDLTSRIIPAPLLDTSASTIRARLATDDPTNIPGLPGPILRILARTNPYRRPA